MRDLGTIGIAVFGPLTLVSAAIGVATSVAGIPRPVLIVLALSTCALVLCVMAFAVASVTARRD